MRFRNRVDAGRQLADRLLRADLTSPFIVLALPRGGVPVAAEIAEALHAPLEVFVARKIGAPGHEEFGIGAVAEGSDEVIASDLAARAGVHPDQLAELAGRARDEVARRVDAYRQGRPLADLADRTVILVDDGLATGVTAEAALRSLRKQQPRQLVLAVPVCAQESRDHLISLADQLMCLSAPASFHSVGQWYDDFTQISDAEVLDLLAKARASTG